MADARASGDAATRQHASPGPPEVTLSLLGGLSLEAGGKPVHLPVRKASALLAYLSMQGSHPQPRDKLTALLWEDRSDEQARHSLRQALTVLRKALPRVAARLQAHGDALLLQEGAVSVDVHAFEAALARGGPDDLEAALALYRGDFLSGFNPRAPAFEDWLMGERSRLRESAASALGGLLEHHAGAGATERAVQLAIRLLTLDPLQEPVHRRLMELYARQGRPGEALRQYRVCRELMQRELGVEVEAETEALYESIRAQRTSGGAPGASSLADMPELSAEPEPAATAGETASPDGPPSADPAAATAMPGDALPLAGPELRHVTVLYASLPAQPGGPAEPEALHAWLQDAYRVVDGQVASHGGRVVQRMAGTVVALFGLPPALGDDGLRAVCAGCELQRALAELRPGAPGASVGVATGAVVAGPTGNEGAYEALSGTAIQAAARLSSIAAPGETRISPRVRRAVGERVDCEPIADESTGEVVGWRVNRVQMPGGTVEPYPLVGRVVERHQMGAMLDLCLQTGRGQAVLVRGEAGVGKTRVLTEVRRMAAERGFACHTAQVLDFGSQAGQEPVRGLLRDLFKFGRDTPQDVREALAASLEADGTVAADDHVFLRDLLDLPQTPESRTVYEAMSEAARHRGKYGVIAALAARAGREQPLLLAVEDIHWTDVLVVRYLASLAEAVRDCRAVLVMTLRTEGEPRDPAWRTALYGVPLTTLELSPLRPEEATELASHMSGVPEALLEQCVQRAAGNPLFLEQLLGAAGAGTDEEVPDSIQSLVWARLDRLAPQHRRALQAASVIGQRFSGEALRYLLEVPDYEALPLVEERLVRPDGEDFLFAHALIAEGVYASLLGSQRRSLHLRMAEWYAGRDSLAHAEHLERAEDPRAAGAYLAAARELAERYRHERALHRARQGLALARSHADQFALTYLEAELLRHMGATEEAVDTYRRASELAGNGLQRSEALIGLAAGLNVLDRYEDALAALEEAEQVAEGRAAPAHLAQLHYQRGNVLFPLGQPEACLQAHETAYRHALEADSPLHQARALSGLGDAYYLRGRMRTAREHFANCVALCREHGFGRLQVPNVAMLGTVHLYDLDLPPAERLLRESIEMAERVDNRRAACVAQDVLTLLLLTRGEWAEAQAEALRCQELARAIGARRFEAEAFTQRAEALWRHGRTGPVPALLQEALSICEETGYSFVGAQVLSTMALTAETPRERAEALARGEALLAEGSVSHAHLHFYAHAIEISVRARDWAEAERYGAALETYAGEEPIGWSEFYGGFARAMAGAGRGAADPALLEALRERARANGLGLALASLDAALEGG